MKKSMFLLTFICFFYQALAQAKASLPESASTIDELKQGISDYLRYSMFPARIEDTSWVQLNNKQGKEIFMLWFSPFSGRAGCCLCGYYYDAKAKKWIRFVNDLIEGTPSLYMKYPVIKKEGYFMEYYSLQNSLVREFNLEVIPPH